MSKSTVVPPKQKLPKCQWRGTVGLTRCVCESPKILGRIVTLETCPGCPFADHVPLDGTKKWKPGKKPKAKPVCQHRGELLRQEKCKVGCVKGTLFDVFQCAVFGECSLHKRNHGIEACAGCDHFKEKSRD